MKPHFPNTTFSKHGYSRMALLLSGLALAGTSLSGCKKEQMAAPMAAEATTQNRPVEGPGIVAGATVNYQLETILPPLSSMIQWKSGYISTSTIQFNAVKIVGSSLAMANFSKPTNTSIPLFELGTLGVISVPFARYQPINFKITAKPMLTSQAISMTGYYETNYSQVDVKMARRIKNPNARVPIQLYIDQPVDLNVKLSDGFLIDQTLYYSILSFSTVVLMENITKSMLDNASRSNGVIVISSTSNVPLYDKIIESLDKVLTVRMGTPVISPAASE